VWAPDLRPRDWLAHDLIVSERRHLLREASASALLVSLLFVMSTLNLSFLRTFNELEIALDGQDLPIRMTSDGIEILAPGERWIWNDTQLVMDRAIFHKMTFLRDAFTAITLVTVGLTVGRELAAARAYAKRTLEPRHPTMAAMWALGARRRWIFDAFTSGKILVLSAAYLAGISVSYVVVLPLVHSITDPNAANLFFSHGPTVGAFALAGSLPIAAWAMHAGSVAWMLRPEALRRASREFA